MMKLLKIVVFMLVAGLSGSLLALPAVAQDGAITVTGELQSIDGDMWIVSNLSVNVGDVELAEPPEQGMTVTIVGVLQPDGIVLAQHVVIHRPETEGDDMQGDDMQGDDMQGDDMQGDDMQGDDMQGDDMQGDDMQGDDSGAPCPLGKGFWKNHPEAWPEDAVPMMLGDQTYTREALADLLHMPVSGDASINLAQQLISARLSLANGSAAEGIAGFVEGADDVLSGYGTELPYGVGPSSEEGQLMVAFAGQLDAYNNGYITAGCNDGAEPFMTEIEGPVVEIDEGDVEWDDDNCANPPPPHAPAHGWHRRCDGQSEDSRSK